jgi:hypothetical protein
MNFVRPKYHLKYVSKNLSVLHANSKEYVQRSVPTKCDLAFGNEPLQAFDGQWRGRHAQICQARQACPAFYLSSLMANSKLCLDFLHEWKRKRSSRPELIIGLLQLRWILRSDIDIPHTKIICLNQPLSTSRP